jgi:2'-5' RNA ligase
VRLFLALQIPKEIRERFAALIAGLRRLDSKSAAKKPRWVTPENLHVTLKFIGQTDASRLDSIRAALAGLRFAHPVHLHFRSIGFFPSAKRPRVIWAGVNASDNLAPLAAEIDRRLAAAGLPDQTHEYKPHLTLARLDPPVMSPELRDAIERNASRDFGELLTGEFHLIESKLKPTGAEYTTLQSFLFVPKD